MTDKNTVIGWLDGLTQDDWRQWHSDSEVQETAKAALKVLKELDVNFPVQKREMYHLSFFACGSCGTVITDGDRFCRMCGKKVKWDD